MPANPPDDNNAPSPTGPKLPNVGTASAIMTASLLLSRILGILRDTAMSAKFGIGIATDPYRLAFAVPDTLFFLIAGGALSSAFIPIFSSFLHTEREDDAWELFNVVVTVMSIVITALIIVLWILAPQLSAFFAAGKDPAIFPLITRMTRIILPAQFAFFIGGLLFGTLYARQRFAMPGLAPNIYNLGIIAGAMIISAFVSPGIVGMAWGALIGAFVGNLLLPIWGVYRLGGRYKPSLNLHAPGVKQVFTLMLPVVLGLSLPAVYGIIMQKFASHYAAGVNTSVDLSNKLMQAPLGIFGQSLALAAFPALSQFFAQKRMDMFRDQLASSMRTVLYLSVPASALLGVLAPQIVNLAFKYGKTKGAALPPVVHCLELFSIGIFAWCLHPVLMRSFYAMHRSAAPIVIGTITTGVFIGLYYLISPLYGPVDGYLALPLSGSLAAILMVIALGTLAYRDTDGFDVLGVLTTLFKTAIASLVMSGIAYGAFHFGPHNPGKLVAFAMFALVVTVSLWAYYFLTKAMGMRESQFVARAMARLRRRPPTTPST
ncbi:MAG: murein biosynthesis integral membrane protein MurJ [Fimbriimonadaceae bacterium]